MVVQSGWLHSLTNGFKLFISNQANGSTILTDVPFEPVTGDTVFDMIYDGDLDGGFFINIYSDGYGADTIGFGGFDLFDWSYIGPGFDEDVYILSTAVSSDQGGQGYYLCLDSSFYPPGGAWVWSMKSSTTVVPYWGGPYCYEIRECCLGNQGNVDLIWGPGGPVDVADLKALVDYLFRGFTDLACVSVGNVDGVGKVDISDLTYLVAYMFLGGPAPPEC